MFLLGLDRHRPTYYLSQDLVFLSASENESRSHFLKMAFTLAFTLMPFHCIYFPKTALLHTHMYRSIVNKHFTQSNTSR